MRTKKVKEPVEYSSTWVCSCDDKSERDFPAMKEHLLSVHGIDTTGLKARKSMNMHMDCEDCHISQFDVAILRDGMADFVVYNSKVVPRHQNDPMRFGH